MVAHCLFYRIVVIKSHIDVADQKVRVNHFFTAPKTEEERELERQLCQDKGAGEWFRLEGGEKKCRDVIQCTVSVRKITYSKVSIKGPVLLNDLV